MTDKSPTPEPRNKPNTLPTKPAPASTWFGRSFAPFRKALTRGLAIVLPPLLTLVLFLWAWNTIDSYVLGPLESTARSVVLWSIEDIHDDKDIQAEIRSREAAGGNPIVREENNHKYYKSPQHGRLVKINRSWIPEQVFEMVSANPGSIQPTTATSFYDRYVQLRYLQRRYVIPAFLALFILILYLLGRLLAAGVGRFIWRSMEAIIERLPLIRNVYSAVKQVTDFAFSENELQFTRIVAVEYPRRGIWSMGFVTGEGMLDIRMAANEPVVSVLMPTSPMPATGFTITVPKSETIDLNITMDQAIQFCVSCGVVVPTEQMSRALINAKVKQRIESMVESKSDSLPENQTVEAQDSST
jgi:uncharacterized membrane protein